MGHHGSKPLTLPTQGVVLGRAAYVYDCLEPLAMLFRHGALHRRIAAALDPAPSGHYLDIGCGTGALARTLAEGLTFGVATGIDASIAMVEIARKKRGGPRCRFEAALAEELPFESASLDGVVSSLFFHHVNMDLKRKCALEILRVLRPGGRVVVADIGAPWNAFGAFYAYAGWILLRQSEIKENIDGAIPLVLREAGMEIDSETRGVLGCMYIWTGRKPQL